MARALLLKRGFHFVAPDRTDTSPFPPSGGIGKGSSGRGIPAAGARAIDPRRNCSHVTVVQCPSLASMTSGSGEKSARSRGQQDHHSASVRKAAAKRLRSRDGDHIALLGSYPRVGKVFTPLGG